MAFQRSNAHPNLEGRSRRIRRTISSWQKRNVRVVLQGLELLGRDGWHEQVGIVGGPGRQGENIAVVWIDNHHRAAFCLCFQRLFRQLLKVQIKSGDHVVSRLRRSDEFLGSFPAVLVESEFVFAVLACEHPIKGLLQSFASLRFRPDRFVIVDNAVGISPGLARVSNNLTGKFSVRINPHINRPPHYASR